MGANRVPRASGDKPWINPRLAISRSVFPAPAGINRPCRRWRILSCSVPRASGDKPSA
ncbi:hypothetical protein CQ988_001724 [Escherichia coli]|nr:hypothetical protein [Escherichia coli]